jgi:hypothetical protein
MAALCSRLILWSLIRILQMYLLFVWTAGSTGRSLAYLSRWNSVRGASQWSEALRQDLDEAERMKPST